jgi:UDP:flavonoid glycosyltransferase YjiC (YdhE family)
MRDREVAAAVGSGSLLKVLKQGADRKQRMAFFERLDTDMMKAVEAAEAIMYKSSWIPFHAYAEKLGVPCVAAMLMPLTPTRSFPSFLLGGGRDRGRIINSRLWRLTEQFVWQVARKFDTKVRREMLDIAPLPFFGPAKRREKQQVPLLYAYSPAVLPRPQATSDEAMQQRAKGIGQRIRAEDGAGAAVEVFLNHASPGG